MSILKVFYRFILKAAIFAFNDYCFVGKINTINFDHSRVYRYLCIRPVQRLRLMFDRKGDILTEVDMNTYRFKQVIKFFNG